MNNVRPLPVDRRQPGCLDITVLITAAVVGLFAAVVINVIRLFT